MNPARKDRWLTLGEVIALLAERYPDLLQLRHRERRQKVRRIVRRAERRDGERYARIVGRELVVSRNALESLLPYDQRSISNLENAVAQNAQNHRQLKREVKAHGSRIRKLEEWRDVAHPYLEYSARLTASEPRHDRVTENHVLSGSRGAKVASG